VVIPIAVPEPIEDAVVLDVDADGDMDMILASPTSADDPLLLLRDDGTASMNFITGGGNTWPKQSLLGNGDSHRLAGGKLDNKDEDDDWVIGGSSAIAFGSEVGRLEQTNMFGQSGGCPEDIDGNGTVSIDDLLLLLGNFNGSGVGDVDGNGIVNVDDMLLVIGAWNTSC
jgi:hypothetical protein